MSYFRTLLEEQGIHAKGVREAITLVMQEPTDDRLRALGAMLASQWLGLDLDCEGAVQMADLLVIVQAERDWLRDHPGVQDLRSLG